MNKKIAAGTILALQILFSYLSFIPFIFELLTPFGYQKTFNLFGFGEKFTFDKDYSVFDSDNQYLGFMNTCGIIALIIAVVIAIACIYIILFKNESEFLDNMLLSSFGELAIVLILGATIGMNNDYIGDYTCEYLIMWGYLLLFFIIGVICFLSVMIKMGKFPQASYVEASKASPVNELQQYKEMFDKGLITKEEFEEKKKKILG